VEGADVSSPTPSRRLPGVRNRGGAKLSNRSGNTLEQIAPNRRQIAVTSFDLLNGAYQVSSRNRRISILILGVVILGLGWQGGQVVQNQLTLTKIEGENLELKERQRAATARFSATTGLPEEVDEKMLFARFENLTDDLKVVSVTSASPFEVLSTITDPSISISSINTRIRTGTSLEKESEDSTTSKDSSASEAGLYDEELFAGLSELKPGEVILETTVVATANDVAGLTRWAQRVRDARIFANVVISRLGAVYTLTGVQVQSRTASTLFTPWSQAGLPIATGATADETADATAESGTEETP
jgi:hypothetical protein